MTSAFRKSNDGGRKRVFRDSGRRTHTLTMDERWVHVHTSETRFLSLFHTCIHMYSHNYSLIILHTKVIHTHTQTFKNTRTCITKRASQMGRYSDAREERERGEEKEKRREERGERRREKRRREPRRAKRHSAVSSLSASKSPE